MSSNYFLLHRDFNQRIISQVTVIIGVSKVYKHIQTLLYPAKLSFFPEFEDEDISIGVTFMHQSIPAVPIPHTHPLWATAGHLLTFASGEVNTVLFPLNPTLR